MYQTVWPDWFTSILQYEVWLFGRWNTKNCTNIIRTKVVTILELILLFTNDINFAANLFTKPINYAALHIGKK
jgi:hypothetical protein